MPTQLVTYKSNVILQMVKKDTEYFMLKDLDSVNVREVQTAGIFHNSVF